MSRSPATNEAPRSGARRRRSSQRVGLFVLLSVPILVIAVAVAAGRSYRDLAAARDRLDLLQREIAATEERSAALEDRIERLRTDAVTWERLAREELGLVAPGEVLIVLPERRPSPSPAQP